MNTRKKAALKLSSLTPESKVTKAQGIIDAMSASSNFPNSSMPIPYANLQNLVTNLQNSILAANAGTTVSTNNMHEQEKILVSTFNLIKAHVEIVANANADPSGVILSAGMQIADNGGGTGVTELTLDAPGNGEVIIKVPRGPDEKAFIYEVSQDGVTFTKVKSSTLSKVVIGGYTPGVSLSVRYHAINKLGETPDSAVKTVIVI